MRDTLRSGVIRLDTLLERAVSFRTTLLVNALASRLQSLRETLRQSHLLLEAEAVGQTLSRLEKEGVRAPVTPVRDQR